MTRHQPEVTSRLRVLVVALLVSVTVGCSTPWGGDRAATGDKGYVSSNGVISRVPEADRVRPGELSGTTFDGAPWSLADQRGKPVVVNVWASWCPPCRAEARDIAAAATELGADASFIGINIRDPRKADAEAFLRTHPAPYPSLYDPAGELLLAFHKTLPPNALPSTVVIDSEGRVAAIVLGPVPSARTLVDLVRDVESS